MTADNLKDIIKRQKQVLTELEAECQAIESSDLTKENNTLKAELERIRMDFDKSAQNAAALTEENAGLKNALYEQIYNEKIKIVSTTAEKLDIYFKSSIDGELNRLSMLENGVKERINSIASALAHNNIDLQDEIYAKLNELSALLDSKVTAARVSAAQISGAFSPQERAELEALKNEQITGEQIRAVTKKNNFERFVGLNLLNVVGIFLIIVGVIAAAQLSYLPNLLRGIMMFSLGGVMLTAGELLNRKKANIFSLGLSAGGVGVLYVALATSYFGLHILEMYPAIAVCALITIGAFVLSTRYRSQTIATFALIGGYLPMLSIGGDDMVLYGAMIYFVALNLLALMVSFSQKWRLAAFVGLFLNIVGTVYIGSHFMFKPSTSEKIITIIYAAFAFLVYTLIPIAGTYRTKSRFRISDVVLLAVNTFVSSLIMYAVFYSFDLEAYNGALAIVFAATYLLLGRFVEKKFTSDERSTRALFYLTGLAFVVLVIPLQFGHMWLSLGWLAEGVLLAAYGILNNHKSFKRYGFIISILCLLAFVLYDCLLSFDYLFAYKYLAITAGSLIILGAYIYKKMMASTFAKTYKYFVMINTWIYILYIIGKARDVLFKAYPNQTAYNIDYLIIAAMIVATFFIAYTVPRIKLLSDFGTKIISIALYAVGICVLFSLNYLSSPVDEYLRLASPELGIKLVGTAILAAVSLLSVLAVRDLMKLIVTERKLGIEWYPLIISGYFVIILTQNLITQFGLSFSSAIISIIYVFTALAWIIFGFMRRYSFIRHFGLAMAILAVIKLFLIDMSSLTQGYRIISYFALGITLVAISFVYQYFSKRLELKKEVAAHVEIEEDN